MATSSLSLVVAVALAAGCDAGARAPTAATVTLTSVAFADDCGGTPPSQAPIVPATPAAAAKRDAAAKPDPAATAEEREARSVHAARRCEQTSMQLSIAARTATVVRVKSVEVFDERGRSLGVLSSRAPTRWSDAHASYRPWDETVGAGQTALVSYVLQQPSFVSHYDERDRTYTVKVLASVGGVDQPLQTTVMVVARPAPVST